MTIYAGDFNNKKLIVLTKGSTLPYYISMDHAPLRGGLMKKDTILVVGC